MIVRAVVYMLGGGNGGCGVCGVWGVEWGPHKGVKEGGEGESKGGQGEP